MRPADPVHNVELRLNHHDQESVVFAFPYRADIVDAVRSIPGRRFDWEAKEWWAPRADATAPYVKGVLEQHASLTVSPEVEAWLARAVRGWVGRVSAGKRLRVGHFVLEKISGELPEVLAERGRRRRRPCVGAVLQGSGRGAARDAGRAARSAGTALRDAAAGQPGPGAGDAGAGRERRRAALHARRQLGPGDDPGVPRASRLRGARPVAAGRSVPAGAARALPAHVRRRAVGDGARRHGPPAARARRGDRRRPPLTLAQRAGARDRGPAGRRAAAVPARRGGLRAGGAAHVPGRRAGPRQDRAGAGDASRPTTPTRPWSCARRR